MAKIAWGNTGERIFEVGIDRGVLYAGGPGVPWNGLTSVAEDSSGGEVEGQYFDGIRYNNIAAFEDFAATLEAFGVPPEFEACQGNRQLAVGLFATLQPRSTFGLCYRTLVGNDVKGSDYGYKLHLVYNCMATPSGRTNKTTSNTIDPDPLQWKIDTVPPASTTMRPTAHFVVDSTKTPIAKLTALEDQLYGTAVITPNLPTQAVVLALLA